MSTKEKKKKAGEEEKKAAKKTPTKKTASKKADSNKASKENLLEEDAKSAAPPKQDDNQSARPPHSSYGGPSPGPAGSGNYPYGVPGYPHQADMLFPGAHGPSPLGMPGSEVCFFHSQAIRFYCDSCEEPICYDCTIMGPHNTQLHRITSVGDAFKGRYDVLVNSIHKTLIPKRD